MAKKTYSLDEIYSIIDAAVSREMELKNAYIEKNGFNVSSVTALNRFDSRITMLSELYGLFKKGGK